MPLQFYYDDNENLELIIPAVIGISAGFQNRTPQVSVSFFFQFLYIFTININIIENLFLIILIYLFKICLKNVKGSQLKIIIIKIMYRIFFRI